MPKDETRAPTAADEEEEEEEEALDKEVGKMEGEVARLEAERAELEGHPVPSWDELQEAGVIEEMERREVRKGLLAKILPAARIKLLQLRLQREEARLPSLEAERAEADGAIASIIAKEHALAEERRLAGGRVQAAWNALTSHASRAKAIRRELAELGAHEEDEGAG